MNGVTAPAADRRVYGAQPSAVDGATAALLWAACRPDPDDPGAEAARARGADLCWASRVSVSQRVSPLLWRVAQRWAEEGDEWSALLRADSLRCKAQAMIVRPRLGSHLMEPLREAGIQPMLIKGAAFAERYPGPGLRPMDDIDLLVRADEHRRAADVLKRAGWRITRRQGPAYSLSLAHPDLPGLPVDLHLELEAGADRAFRFGATQLWDARRTVDLYGGPAFIAEPELELLLIATHAAKPFHNFDRLIWAVDAAVVIGAAASAGEPIDWKRVAESSERAAARSAMAVLLTQAGRLGASSPDWLRDVHGGRTRRWALTPPRSETWPLETLGGAERSRLTLAVIDDPWRRVRQFVHQAGLQGWLRAPDRAAAMTWWILRRLWRVRRAAPDAGTSDPPAGQPEQPGSLEQPDGHVEPVVADGQP